MFCPKCGKQLSDGEVCTCMQTAPVPGPAPEFSQGGYPGGNGTLGSSKKNLPVLAVTGIILVLVIVLIIVLAVSCSNKSSYQTPINNFFTGIQKNDPDLIISALGKDEYYAAYEEYYEEYEDYFEDEYDNGKEMADEVMDEYADDFHDILGDFTYEIRDARRIDKDDAKYLDYALYLIDDLNITDAYCVSIRYKAEDDDIEDELNDEWDEVYVGKVGGRWILLNYGDMFDLY